MFYLKIEIWIKVQKTSSTKYKHFQFKFLKVFLFEICANVQMIFSESVLHLLNNWKFYSILLMSKYIWNISYDSYFKATTKPFNYIFETAHIIWFFYILHWKYYWRRGIPSYFSMIFSKDLYWMRAVKVVQKNAIYKHCFWE